MAIAYQGSCHCGTVRFSYEGEAITKGVRCNCSFCSRRGAMASAETIPAEKLKIDHWRDKEATRDAVQIVIKNFLWNDQTGLPVESYTEEDVEEKSEEVFRHVWRAYPYLPSPVYAV